MRWVILLLMCLLFAGPHVFSVPAPPVPEPEVASVAGTGPTFWDRSEETINGWMKRNLPDFVYAWAPRLLSPTFETLASLYRWGRITTQDPQAGWIAHQAARATLWMFYHPWITGLVGLVLMLRGRRWIFWPLRRILFRRR
ncbi:MAG: hypothetical protein ACKO43_05410 [Alphaproteobacteria bacterium]